MVKRISLLVAVLLICFSFSVFAIEEGDLLPDFEVKDLDGNTVKISDFRGQYVLYDVWATWCGPCTKAMKAYVTNYDKFESAGIKIIALSVDKEVDAPIKYLEKNPMPFTILHMDRGENGKNNPASELWGVRGIPTMFLVDPDGKIILKEVGFSHFAELWEKINQVVEKANSVTVKYPALKVGTYGTKPVVIDYSVLTKDLTFDFVDYDWKEFTAESEVELIVPKCPNTPVYGVVYIGDRTYSMAMVDSEGSELNDLIYVDYNANFDLTDDGEPVKMGPSTEDENKAVITLDVMVDDKAVPFEIRAYSYLWNDAVVNDFCMFALQGYEVLVDTDQGAIKVLVIDVDKNGYFDTADALLVDVNGNGIFDSYHSVQEWTKSGWDYILGVNTYIFDIAKNGKEITIKSAK